MPSATSPGKDAQLLTNSAQPGSGTQDHSSPSSTATTLVSRSDSQTPIHPSRPVIKGLKALQTLDENSVTEAGTSSLASTLTIQGGTMNSAQRRVHELKKDMQKAGAEINFTKKSMFREAYSTDLLFLIDTTSSMKPYIDAAKNQVKAIIKEIKSTFFDDVEVRIAIVAYRDHCDKPNIQFLNFTPIVDDTHAFLDKLKAMGGADIPEDVLGGIKQALNATWSYQTRCIIHIADAPPHGTKYHDFREKDDNFPGTGSEPHGLTLEPLLDQLIKLNINYALLRITKDTDKMASIFYEKYAAASAGAKLFPTNRYASKMPEKLGGSEKGAYSGLLFEEQELGSKFSALQHLVIKSVTQSASRSAVRMISSVTKSSKMQTGSKLDTGLAAIDEDDNDPIIQMETRKPQWNSRGWLDETLTVEGFCPNLTMESSSTLDDMLKHEDNIDINAVELLIHKRSRPFSQGATRLAFYARAQTMSDRFVVKSFKKEGKPFTHFAKDMQCQALCKAFALEFNSLLGQETIFDFIVTTCLKGKKKTATDSDEQDFLSLEPFIEGTYIKYNSNCGYVNNDLPDDSLNQAAQAFSHFTFERSRGRFLVCDLQGVGGVLTDPAVHTVDPERFKLGDTNLGSDGFKFFFATHACNDVCRRLELKSNATMLTRGLYTFRTDWPALGNMFRCCSNKLCGKITRLPADYDPNTPQRYHWCYSCYQQMRSSFERIVCVVRPTHDFTVSRFLCESQGLAMPRACHEHRGQEIQLAERRRESFASSDGQRSSMGNDGGGFWSRLRKRSSK
ncbi:hypothetical protein R6Q59_010216 [Mikania micrantha]